MDLEKARVKTAVVVDMRNHRDSWLVEEKVHEMALEIWEDGNLAVAKQLDTSMQKLVAHNSV